MDFVAKEIFYLFWFSLTLGAFGTIKFAPLNRAVSDGAKDIFMSCTSSSDANLIKWSFTPVGSNEDKTIKNGDSITDDAFGGRVEPRGKEYTIIIKTASASTAGTYVCEETDKKSAVLIVLTREPSCDYTPRETKTLPCNSNLTLSSTVSYIADTTVVSAVLKWSKITALSGTLYLEGQQTPPSASGIITTTSTLNVELPTDGGEMPKYTCEATFTVKASAKWPTMNQQEAICNHQCQLFDPPVSVPCGGKEDPGDTGAKGEQAKENSSVRSAETNNLAIRVLGVAGVLLLAQVL